LPFETLPVVDISRLNAGPEEASQFRDELRNAMHEVGFLYLAGHGIPQELTDAMLDVSAASSSCPRGRSLRLRTSIARSSVVTRASAENSPTAQ
jgi:isopenicillin N synthase-like dioxygenase